MPGPDEPVPMPTEVAMYLRLSRPVSWIRVRQGLHSADRRGVAYDRRIRRTERAHVASHRPVGDPIYELPYLLLGAGQNRVRSSTYKRHQSAEAPSS